MKKLFLTLFCLFAIATSAACGDDDDDATLTVENQSSFVFTSLSVVPTSTIGLPVFEDDDDLLNGTDLFPGEAVTVEVDCGIYDVRIEDELGESCELFGIELCFEDSIWIVDDAELEDCTF